MESIKGELARKLIEMQTDAEAKEVLLTGIDCGWIELKIEAMTAHTIPPTKERKKRVKKEKITSQAVPDPSALRDELPPPNPCLVPTPRKSRKTLEQKCKEMEANYPDLWQKAVDKICPLSNKMTQNFLTRKQVLAEFDLLFKEKKN